jgi:hypothetical protein
MTSSPTDPAVAVTYPDLRDPPVIPARRNQFPLGFADEHPDHAVGVLFAGEVVLERHPLRRAHEVDARPEPLRRGVGPPLLVRPRHQRHGPDFSLGEQRAGEHDVLPRVAGRRLDQDRFAGHAELQRDLTVMDRSAVWTATPGSRLPRPMPASDRRRGCRRSW